MDSLTQFVLGAAVGDVVAGKKLGNKAMLWGAVGGTIPDLDVLLNFIYAEPASLIMHRGFSHSIFFAMLAAPVFGWILHKADQSASVKLWMSLFFWTIITHPLLDIFTGYGTGLFVPVWDYRIQFDTISIVDPVYTLPLLIAFVWLLVKGKPFEKRCQKSRTALIISSTYLLITVVIKLTILTRIDKELERQAIRSEKTMAAPAIFNTFLWSVVVQHGEEFKVGYASILDTKPNITFKSIPAQHNLLPPEGHSEEVDILRKFTKGYFVVENKGGQLVLNDLRFGTTRGWVDTGGAYIFSFVIKEENGEVSVERRPTEMNVSKADFDALMDRTLGY